MAVSADASHWFLLNASPDLLAQIHSFPPLAAHPNTIRNSPIQGVLLTNGDLDHTLGLALLREGEPLAVYSTLRVKEALTEGLALLPMVQRYCGLAWHDVAPNTFELDYRNGTPSGLLVKAIDIPGCAPKYHATPTRRAQGDSVAYIFTDTRSGGVLVFAPDVSIPTPELVDALKRADVVLYDGTFWSEHEMLESGAGTALAADMGHQPISGPGGSLDILAALPTPHRVYMHINNTNPILLEDSPERQQVADRGVEVGKDGMEFEL